MDAETGRIPTAIISGGPHAATHTPVAQHLAQSEGIDGTRCFVSLPSSSGGNLKALLKQIINKASARADGIDEDENEDELPVRRKDTKLLNYDLQILSEYVRERSILQVVLAFEDTEAFDSDLLSELIELLGCWHDRIPFVLLFNIATSADFLQERISKGAIKVLNGHLFDVAPFEEEIEQVFEAITEPDVPLWIGPGLLSALLERQSDYIGSIDGFVDALQYAYMSCYYANALSIFLAPHLERKQGMRDHFEAIRNLRSFQDYCHHLLEEEDVSRVRDLLDQDDVLFALVQEKLLKGRSTLAEVMVAVDVIHRLQSALQPSQRALKSKLYLQAMSGKLRGSSLVRSLLLSVRKSSSANAAKAIEAVAVCDLSGEIQEQCTEIRNELFELMAKQADCSQPLRSEDDVNNSTLRTTVVAQKVELSKQKSSLSEQDAAYTEILRRFTDLLEQVLDSTLVDPKSLVFHEIFIYDLKSPHREVFTPRPRHAIERALAAPHDYLDCDCCAPGPSDGDDATLASSQPATAVLYQLYLESGSLINASDLFQAFQAVRSDDRTEGESMALFQRSLAELRYLGLVKSTRKRVDHVTKVAWRGL